MGFFSGDGTNSFTGSFWGTLLEVDGWTSVGRSEMSLGGLEGTSILAVLAVIVVLSSVAKYTKIASCTYLHS